MAVRLLDVKKRYQNIKSQYEEKEKEKDEIDFTIVEKRIQTNPKYVPGFIWKSYGKRGKDKKERKGVVSSQYSTQFSKCWEGVLSIVRKNSLPLSQKITI